MASAIHESTKFLIHEAFNLFVEAIDEGKSARAAELRKSILDVFDNTIDGNSKLLDRINQKEGSNGQG